VPGKRTTDAAGQDRKERAPEMIGAPVGWQLQPASTLVLDTEARW
jgi:hypothetical protein